MEVFLKNVPIDVGEDRLKKELTPFFNALSIVDFIVDKPKRKPMAWVSFLRHSDGEAFLKTHGKVAALPTPQKSSPTDGDAFSKKHGKAAAAAAVASPQKPHPSGGRLRDIARLHLLKTPIFAERSRRPVNKMALHRLAHERDERQKKPDRSQPAPAIICAINAVSCGKIVFAPPEMGLKYIQQIHHRLEATAKFGPQFLTVHEEEVARMDIPYHVIQSVILDDGSQSMTLILEDPPRFFVARSDLDGQGAKWERLTSFPLWANHAKYVSHCLVYQLTLAGGYTSTVRALKRQDILSLNHQSIPLTATLIPTVEDYSTAMNAFEGKMQSLGNTTKHVLPFPILFQVQTLVWNNYLHPHSGLRVLEIIESTARDAAWKGETPPYTVDSMKRLLRNIPYPDTGTDPADVDPVTFLQRVAQEETDLRSRDVSRQGVYGPSVPRHQTWVFKAMVAPTRIFLQGPDPESRNRVLRMFPDHGDYFLRVTFCDEDGQDLSFNPRVSNDAIYERYRQVLLKGIRIAGRQFSFLGFSHSSLRSHSTWFMAPFVGADGQRQSRDTILAALGDFSDIRIPAKCAARIGQAFSETPYAVDLLKSGIGVRWISDVKSADGERVFSDGVGTLSRAAVEEFCKALPGRSTTATCFQIRWAGVKGLLVLDTRLQGKTICVRKESMMKFPSRDIQELGICDLASRPLRLVLNRQVIKILEDMGTHDSWFLALQHDALEFLRAVTATALNTSTFLQYQDIGSAIGLSSFIKQLDKMDIDYRRDAFLKSVVEHVVLRELRLLKHKARIPVHKGVTLFGVMDETGFLQENQVYVTYDATRGKSGERLDTTLTDGPIIVTRSPALHPGDIQCVQMVTPPESHPLRSLRNCIVFSQKGSRDLPSQLSGGDLDGDLYNIIWDPRARPQWTFAPADYTRVVPPSLDRPVTRQDIADFFVDFMKSDILGLIAIRHQIMADVQDLGTQDGECIRLAEMHSTAVDYSKTGIAVNWRDLPRAPRSRPDFLAPAPPLHLYDLGQIGHIAEEDDDDGNDMALAKPRYHRSEKILGRLYREIDEGKIWSEDIHRPIPTDGPSVWVQLLGRVQYELNSWNIGTDYARHYEQAWNIRTLYEDAITGSMWHFSDNPRSPVSEAEVFCGSILNKRGVQSRQQREASIRLKDEIDRVMTWIVKLIRDGTDQRGDNTAYQDDDGVTDDYDEYRAIQLSWACLVVGCVPSAEQAASSGTAALESFRVVAAACLLKELNDLRNNMLEEKFSALDIKHSRRG
ncbi:RNA-dependent RNA polymerase 1 [Beauveria bassiana D1-5]|uniref:RNA-dependent RNA polymerase n=1 Tax=Beauveria bassiana D1-5 TaxID=1245745 RepID=A0A0A2VU66_BEABA|nr:RNA-dependent RNA polymerase 1 [Beauveria bassiana D1-5]